MTMKDPGHESLAATDRLNEASLSNVLGYQLTRASLAADQVFDEIAASQGDLRKVDYAVLTLVTENPKASPVRLARALAVTPPHITAIVDRLVARSLVLREVSHPDKRGQSLVATRAGRELARKFSDAITAMERATLCLSRGEHAILLELLRKVGGARHSGAAAAARQKAPRQSSRR